MPSLRLRPAARRAAFTLIELLIVMGIIATLIAIAIPAVTKAREASNRTVCTNNLHQMGTAVVHYYGDFHYFPTAGANDLSAPSFPASVSGTPPVTTFATVPTNGWQQEAGWAFQLLPYLGSDDLAWSTSSPDAKTTAPVSNAFSVPIAGYICPSRRIPKTQSYTPTPSWPGGSTYSATYYTPATAPATITMAPIDYAACAGGLGLGTTTLGPYKTVGLGAVRTQAFGKDTVRREDIKDGPGYQLLVGEKAANPFISVSLTNEDDQSYAAGFSGLNYNTIRFTSVVLLPLRDSEVKATTGGAFGSAHPGTWNALMCDGSVHQISYSMDPKIFTYLGCINDGNIVKSTDLDP
jgi:prepilin-type N-terminal cleavage/methylation domain-containing protein